MFRERTKAVFAALGYSWVPVLRSLAVASVLSLVVGTTLAESTANPKSPRMTPQQTGIVQKSMAMPTVRDKKAALFSGFVLSPNNKTLANAMIEVAGQSVRSDKTGWFSVEVPSDKRPVDGRYILNISKAGYGPLSRVYRQAFDNGRWVLTPGTVQTINPRRTNVLRNVRSAVDCAGTLSSRAEWAEYPSRRVPHIVNEQGLVSAEVSEVVQEAIEFVEESVGCNPGVVLVLPANSLADDQGVQPNALVTVTISTVDILDPDSMPGDYSVVMPGRGAYMVPYGATSITMHSGKRSINLKKGATATLIIPVHTSQLRGRKQPPQEIPLLVYDKGSGMWFREASAQYDRQRRAYVTALSHLSTFNMDLVKQNQACVRVNSSALSTDYTLEVTVPWEGGTVVRGHSVDNTPETLHAIYNLPSHADVVLRAFRVGSLGEVVPISDTLVVNTGAEQSPSTPNAPLYPYQACQAQVSLTERPTVPLLTGPTTSATGQIQLHWHYVWSSSLGSSSNGFALEESSTGEATGFTTIYSTVNQNDRRTDVDFTVTHGSSGTYWYRVRANETTGWTPYSNVLRVNVNAPIIVSTPARVNIVNNLQAWVVSGNNLNGIVSVRIAPTQAQVEGADPTFERLYSGDTTANVADTAIISTGGAQGFDVSGLGVSANGSYYVQLTTGWWEPYFDPNTSDFLWWQKRTARVLNCTGQCCVLKSNWTKVHTPFYDPEPIVAGTLLPAGQWQGSSFCTP